MLHKVLLNKWRNEERWEGNLNSTIQKLFREQNDERRIPTHAMIDEHEDSKEDQSNPLNTTKFGNVRILRKIRVILRLLTPKKPVDANAAPPRFLCVD
ncbi:hypothetical protein V6N13_103213 [Hibiscus sabdariffa]